MIDDTIDARVYQGIHFRSADEDGAWIGKKVARWLDKHYLEPVHGDDDDDDGRRRLIEAEDGDVTGRGSPRPVRVPAWDPGSVFGGAGGLTSESDAVYLRLAAVSAFRRSTGKSVHGVRGK